VIAIAVTKSQDLDLVTESRKAESGRDRITAVTTYEEVEEAFDYSFDMDSIYDEEDIEYGAVRVFTSGESATVHFFPDEELKDQETLYGLIEDDADPRAEYSETLEPLYEVFGGEERVGELIGNLLE
jgi:hypothetical protein